MADDGEFRGFGGDGDGEDDYDFKYDAFEQDEGGGEARGPTKESILWVIDCSDEMFVEEDTKFKAADGTEATEKRSQWTEVMGTVADFMKSKVISNEDDRVGVVLFNVGETKNKNDFPGIYVLQPLEQLTAQRIRDLRSEGKRDFSSFQETYGGNAGADRKLGDGKQKRAALSDVFWACHSLFLEQEGGASAFSNRVMLFTCDDGRDSFGTGPESDRAKLAAKMKAQDLQEEVASVELYALEPKHRTRTFDLKYFWADAVFVDESTDEWRETMKVRLGEMANVLRMRTYKQRAMVRLRMEVCEGFAVSVGLYSSIVPAKPPYPRRVCASDNETLKTETKTVCIETGKLLGSEQIETFFRFGGERIKFSPEERGQLNSFDSPGFKLLGFKNRSFLKPWHVIRSPYFLAPHRGDLKGSDEFIASLIASMQKKGQVAIVRAIPRRNAPPQFSALIPQEDEEEEDGGPRGFNMIPLPWADDIRSLDLPHTKVEMDEHERDENITNCKAVLKSEEGELTVKKFAPVDNPVVQKFYAGLEALALNEEDMVEPADQLVPHATAMEKFEDETLKWRKASVKREGGGGGGG
eukprot:Cvel_50.t1-p1 / transcript=Cvel_50.t1 / gene=Cvel_50 / organism=Chromera_velia_CCMP2878 / gene_product=X-ray repair cross-complementing protein 5, putative / transcript_product=X-ray repair cross-complementing protein 5, putative / location=Cvel_scaffold5:292550-298504(+) / protein_length=581 / sequence_SO=supercontig / SO=protein_coding / is_pseudo=false